MVTGIEQFGCVKLRWLPLPPLSVNPACFRSFIISRSLGGMKVWYQCDTIVSMGEWMLNIVNIVVVECHYIVDGNMCQHIVNKVL